MSRASRTGSISSSATETSQARGKEFLGRIFTREQDRDETPTLA
jgi:hypothetical protein